MSLPWELDDGVRSNIARARITKVDDEKSQQRVNLKARKKEEPQEIFRPQAHGISSNPPKDSEGYLLGMGSRSDRMLYVDGGHEKYRPKNTPEGDTVLYNHSGDVIRVFKEASEVVHSKKVSIKLGKGNDVGQGDGESRNISLTMTPGGGVIIAFEDATVTWKPGRIDVKAPKVVIDSPDVNLGGEGGTLIGLCGGGCATKVKAV